MPPTRRNLVIIGCLCILTIYISASVRVYQSSSPQPKAAILPLPFEPYKGPASEFFSRTPEKAVQPTSTPQVVRADNPPRTQPVTSPTPAQITARAYMVADLESDEVFIEKNSAAVLPVASMSKLITAFVATEVIDDDILISISEDNAALPPDTSKLTAGEKMPLKTILYPLLLSSSNVAAEALASAVNRTDFLESMSSYAWEVGMPSSYFADASGLSPQNAASARDMLALARYLHSSRQDILQITRTPMSAVGTTTDHGSHTFVSTHPFVSDPNFLGGKTGRTPEAGETMITLMKIADRSVALVVLGSQYGHRESDTRLLIEKVKKEL